MALGDGVRRSVATISDEERTLFINAIKTLDTTAFVYPDNQGNDPGNVTY